MDLVCLTGVPINEKENTSTISNVNYMVFADLFSYHHSKFPFDCHVEYLL